MTKSGDENSAFQDSFGSKLIQESKVHVNLAQDVIVITEDRFRLCLMDHIARVTTKSGWIAPLSLFVTLLIVFATSKFQDYVLPAKTWQAIFVICAVATFVWSIVAVYKALSSKTTIDTLIKEVKQNSGQLSGE